MERYERAVGIKTIYLTLVRRFHLIIFLFMPIALGSFIITNFVMKKTYQSSSTLTKNTVFTAANYQNAQIIIKSESTLAKVSDGLISKNVVHSNGSSITINEIESGLSFSSFTTGSSTVSISLFFQSRDSKIVQPVLEEINSVSVNVLKVEKDFETIYISKEATKATKNSKEDRYFLIALAAGAVISLGIPFVYEIFSDELYDADDVEYLGCDAFEIKTGGK